MLSKPTKSTGRKLFWPDFIADSVSEIDFNLLNFKGIKVVLIDLDGTVVSRGTFSVDQNLSEFLKKQKVDIYIATNRPKSRSLRNLELLLHARSVIHPKGMSVKPLPGYYSRALSTHDLRRNEVAMIGDRFIQDIFGANLAGLTTILIRKLGKSHGIFDKQLSKIERRYTERLASKYTS
jgi:HAD superfamily phosphatase (TIGR01668 family)